MEAFVLPQQPAVKKTRRGPESGLSSVEGVRRAAPGQRFAVRHSLCSLAHSLCGVFCAKDASEGRSERTIRQQGRKEGGGGASSIRKCSLGGKYLILGVLGEYFRGLSFSRSISTVARRFANEKDRRSRCRLTRCARSIAVPRLLLQNKRFFLWGLIIHAFASTGRCFCLCCTIVVIYSCNCQTVRNPFAIRLILRSS